DRALGGWIDAAQGNGDDLGAGGAQRLLHLLQRTEAAGAGDQPRGPLAPAELPGLGAALDRGEDLDALPLAQRRPLPLSARHDLAVESGRDATPLGDTGLGAGAGTGGRGGAGGGAAC